MSHAENGDHVVDLLAPFTSDTLLEVRQGKMKRMDGLTIESGIDKQICVGPVTVTSGGVVGDEHDYTFHGGRDKAIHGYCCTHYPDWQAEFPSAAERFKPGGFGENFVTAHMNERNLCLGDVVSVGNSVLLEVSLPRQPCFKLNHRFKLKGFAPNTWKTNRTGWYYRVLRGGTVAAGDQIRLVERRHPDWTIKRLQEYMYFVKDDLATNEFLAGMEELGAECRDMFKGRVAKQKAAERKKAQAQQETQKWRGYRVVEKRCQTPRVCSFVFEPVAPELDPEPLMEGAHTRIRLGNGLERSYSIVTGDRTRFELGVAREECGRGGSRYLHDEVGVGDVVQVGAMTCTVPSASAASHRIFVAGGIGITAFLPLIEAMERIHYSLTLHYAVRSADEIPFRERVDALGDLVVIYDASKGQRLDIPRVIRTAPWNSNFYFCGPARLMDEAQRETRAAGVAQSEVHFEAFAADASGDPFEVVVANRGDPCRELVVGADETLLDVLRRHFDDVPSSCEVGNCGTCKVVLREGRVEHRGTALLDEEKKGAMLSCVSRGVGRIVVDI